MRSQGAPLRGQPGLLWGVGVPQSGARRGQALQAQAQGRRLESKVFRDPSREGAEGSGFLKVHGRNGGGGVGIYAGPSSCSCPYSPKCVGLGSLQHSTTKEEVWLNGNRAEAGPRKGR